MGVDFFKLFNLKKEPEEYVAILPGNKIEAGNFNPSSGTWIYIEAWAKEKLDNAREKNDKLSLSIEKTSALRGRIATLKELLELPETGK